MNIIYYREYIDTECSRLNNVVLDIKAIKVDGNNSLKMSLKCGNLNSCDYFRYKKDKFLLIEITDLNYQLQNLNSELSGIDTSTMGKKTSKKFKPMHIIQKELKDKISNTQLILNELQKVLNFSLNKLKIFIVALCTTSQSDIMIFDKIKRDLKRQLGVLVDDIWLVPVMELNRILNAK